MRWVIILIVLLATMASTIWLNPRWRTRLGNLFTGTPVAPTPARLYRWTDDQGQVHITDRPPADGRAYTIETVDPRTNVIPAENLTGKREN